MKHFLSSLVPWKVKNLLYHLPQAVLANIFYGFPARKLKVIGITGTNGKTTTTRLVARILEEANKKIAVASTIDFQIGENRMTNASKFTTLVDWKLQKFLREAVDAGCEYAVLETSSHALDQYRVWGVPYEVAVITNVTREHLDYHKTMEAYRRAKRRLFDHAKQVVVNLDMWEPEFFLSGAEKKRTYSRVDPTADIFAEDIRLSLDGAEFLVANVPFSTRLPGIFNVENILAAVAATSSVGIPIPLAAKAVARVNLVPGRVEKIRNHIGATIIIDYAVTPDSLEKLYALVSSMRKEGSKVVSVFGSCGERDRGKRPTMGEIVSSNADVVILTNEDPYREDPNRILDEIEAGVKGKERGKDFFRIFDRRDAIRKAISLLGPDDILLVTGKGAEETMAVGDERIPWSDRQVISEELARMKNEDK